MHGLSSSYALIIVEHDAFHATELRKVYPSLDRTLARTAANA
jgi:hypothetical protein